MKHSRLARIVLAAALVTPGLLTSTARAATCAPGAGGGEWRNFGQDLANTRNQPDEHVINASNALNLAPAWIISTTNMGPGVSGGFHNTPIVADGCLYLGTSTGWVIALNADTGVTQWTRKLVGDTSTLVGDVITGSPAVGRDFVYVGVGVNGAPYVQQLNQADGTLGWKTVVDTRSSDFLVTGPQLYFPNDTLYPKGLLFQGFMGGENQGIVSPGNNTARGGFVIIDAATGAILAKDYTISDAEYADGYRGASIWGTAAIDETELYAYAPTGNPATAKKEAPMANSILKIDVNPARPDTFGKIVGSYHDAPDNYVQATDLYQAATCQAAGQVTVIWSQTCTQFDLDFGGAPSLFTDSDGTKLVGDLQKAGIYHAVNRDTMSKAWTTVVGTPEFPLNANSPAVAGGRVFTAGQLPGQMVGLGVDDGFYQWLTPMPDGLHYQAVSVANGVVYTGDTFGNFRAFDAATGIPLLVRSLSMDTHQNATDSANSSGIAIARNTVYYPTSSGYLAAFRLP